MATMHRPTAPWQEIERPVNDGVSLLQMLGSFIVLSVSAPLAIALPFAAAAGVLAENDTGLRLLRLLVALPVWACCVLLAYFSFRWMCRAWKRHRQSTRARLQQSVGGTDAAIRFDETTLRGAFLPKIEGAGTYRWDCDSLVFPDIVVIPSLLPAKVAWAIEIALFAIIVLVSQAGEDLGAPLGPTIILACLACAVGLRLLDVLYARFFTKAVDLRVQDSNVRSIRIVGSHVTLRLKKAVMRDHKTLTFVVSQQHCAGFFANLDKWCPGWVPEEYKSAMRQRSWPRR